MWSLLIAALVAVFIGFLLASAEAAFNRIGRGQAEEYLEDGRRGSQALIWVLEDTGSSLMVLTFLRVISEATAAVLVTMAVSDWLHAFWARLFTAIAIMAVFSFVLVGVSPRTWGRQHAGSVALMSAPAVRWFATVLGPVARGLVTIGNAVTPGRGYRDGPFDSEAELRELVDMASESDLIEADERKMIHSVFELGDTVAREVMVPRIDMVVIDAGKTMRQALSLFLRSGFSRVPVVDGNPDDVVGVAYLKDVVDRITTSDANQGAPVTDVAREAVFVPDSKPADELLKEMQAGRRHFAIVVDEYGGTSGIVTLEDILEEVVGEIDDEFDRVSPTVQELDDGMTRVPARMSVDDFAELFDVDIEDDDVDTVGGLLTKLCGRVPLPGATGTIEGVTLTAERMAGRRHQLASIVVDRLPVRPHERDAPELDRASLAAADGKTGETGPAGTDRNNADRNRTDRNNADRNNAGERDAAVADATRTPDSTRTTQTHQENR